LTPEQNKWMELIRRHLVADLAIEQDDFTLLDFEQQGATWRRVNSDFGGTLADLLARLNEQVAT
jgi:type I restriction enzyme R subunit